MSEKENIFELGIMKKISERRKVEKQIKNKGFKITHDDSV
jgi:hypothetical protein